MKPAVALAVLFSGSAGTPTGGPRPSPVQRKSFLPRSIGYALTLVSCVASSLLAADVEIPVDQPHQTAAIDNPGPPVVPTVYVVGQPDRMGAPVRKTKGLTLDGVRLTETLLSESVLILRPDGTGSWGYHAGFDIFREPDLRDGRRIDPRSLVEYDKWRYDPLEPVTVIGGDINLLRLCYNGAHRPARYEIAFPAPITIRSLRIASNCDGLSKPGVSVRARLHADEQRKQLIAERMIGPEQGTKHFPVVFDGLGQSRIYLELSAEAPPGAAVDLYYTFFEAQLDTRGLRLPRLGTGENRLTLTGDPDGSHRARVVLRWTERPPAERVWEDFEDGPRWSGCTLVAGGPESGLAFTGERFARATFAADGRDYSLNRSLPSQDLTAYNRLGIASRAVRDAPMRAILFGIKNGDTAYQYVRPRPESRWNFQTFDISAFRRDNVVAMNFYWTALPGFNRADDPCVYDIDSICLWHEEPAAATAGALPARIANYVSPLPDTPPLERPIRPVQEWFPMGFYDGICGRSTRECEWLFDQMRRLHMNAVYVSNGNPEGLERILPLAERRGIRLIYQGSGEGTMYYEHLATATARQRSLEQVILPHARQWLPRFRDRWSLAAWSLTEEIGPELSGELPPYYELVRELAPNHPPTVLHNNLAAATRDLETNKPSVVTCDFYPFFWSPRSGPSNPGRSVPYYRGRVSSFYRACREHGASLWMMPQAWGTAESAPLDPPDYGYRTGMRTPEPGEIKLQGWVAVAEGATGILFYAAEARRPGEHQLWDRDWTETANTRAAAELFGRITRVAPLLCRLERDYREEGFVQCSNPRVLAHSFVKRKGYPGNARYIVLASLDGFGPQSLDLSITGSGRVHDMIDRKDITASPAHLELAAGEGRLLFVGSQPDLDQDRAMIEERQGVLDEGGVSSSERNH